MLLQVAAPGDWKNGVPKEVEVAIGELEAEPGTAASSSIDETLRFPLSLSDPSTSTDKSKLCPLRGLPGYGSKGDVEVEVFADRICRMP
jgi:hypothetical protein